MFKPLPFRWIAAMTVVMLLAFSWLGYRLYILQIIRHEELAGKEKRFTRTTRVAQPWRGEIRDRRGKPLAIPVQVLNVYADLTVCSNRCDQVARTLAPLLGINEGEMAQTLRSPPVRRGVTEPKAVLLKKRVSLWEWDTITNALAQAAFGFNVQALTKADKRLLSRLRGKSLFAQSDQMRIYPEGAPLAHVLGYVSVQTNGNRLKGVKGIEASFDKVLGGVRGCSHSEQDAGGNELPERRRQHVEPVDGNNVILTIDLDLQKMVEEVLSEAMRKHHPRSASAVVVRPRTGEILAWAVLPNYNPQDPGNSPPTTWWNHALSDRVEPGSTLKAMFMAAALNEGLIDLEQVIYCENGLWRSKTFKVRDHAPYAYSQARQCFAKSSNIAFAKIALLLGPQKAYQYLLNFGFGQCTGIELPDETPGGLGAPAQWSTEKLARMGFGQGIAVSQLQMTMALSAIANDGVLMRPMLVSRIESPEGKVLQQRQPVAVRRVITPKTAGMMKSALQGVVSPGGTGASAALDDYSAGVKTGTAQKSDQAGYLSGRYYTSFIGSLPVETPELCISVALDEPQKEYYASVVAAPVFRSIAQRAARLLAIPPDRISEGTVARRAGQSASAELASIALGLPKLDAPRLISSRRPTP